MGLSDLKRITDLFVEGTELVLQADADPPVLLWVNKLNPFQREEAQRDGQAARSRMILATKENGSPEYMTFEARLVDMDDAKLRTSIVEQKQNQYFLDAMDDMRRDKDWAERILAASRITPDMPQDEQEAVAKINADYSEALGVKIEERQGQALEDLMGNSTEDLKDKFRTNWLEDHGFVAYQREYNKTALFYGVRTCNAVKNNLGGWDHSPCNNHVMRTLDSREDVTKLPGGLLEKLQATSRAVEVPQRDARFSDAPSSSSASSVQPNEQADSTPSTPEVTPAAAPAT